jgi:CRP-like cAMP-binding protein
MSDPDVQPLLGQLEFSRHLPARALAELSRIGERRDVPVGTVLFKEGEKHGLIYVLCSGKIVLDMPVPGRGDVRILSLGAGDLLGWSPVVGDSMMTATATAKEATTVIAIPGDELNRICESDHEIGHQVMRQVAAAMSRRLLATRLQLLDLFAETTPEASPADRRLRQDLAPRDQP